MLIGWYVRCHTHVSVWDHLSLFPELFGLFFCIRQSCYMNKITSSVCSFFVLCVAFQLQQNHLRHLFGTLLSSIIDWTFNSLLKEELNGLNLLKLGNNNTKNLVRWYKKYSKNLIIFNDTLNIFLAFIIFSYYVYLVRWYKGKTEKVQITPHIRILSI